MRNFMRNHRDKGYPDSDHVKDESSLSASSSTLTPISETLPQHSASSSVVTLSRPSGYPHTNNQHAAWINQDTHNNSFIHPPTAYPYAAHQEGRKCSRVSKGTINTGHNQNKKGRQKTGEVSIGNRAAGSESASSSVPIPENINTGNNINEGDSQETGSVKLGNVG